MVILAAVDRSKRAEAVIEQARSLARAFGDEIHVVHVLTYSEFTDLEQTNVERTGTAIPVDEIRAVAANIAEQTVADTEGTFQFVGLVGHPADSIVDYAEDHAVRYIVTAGRKRSPAGKALFGSVAHSIIMNAQSPVVVTIDRED
jgi:nucleotide-binding universal stress UspA family protein